MVALDEVPMRVRGRGDVAHRAGVILMGWIADTPTIGYLTPCGIVGELTQLQSGVGYPACETCWPGERTAA